MERETILLIKEKKVKLWALCCLFAPFAPLYGYTNQFLAKSVRKDTFSYRNIRLTKLYFGIYQNILEASADLQIGASGVNEFILPSTTVLSKSTCNEFSREIKPFAVHTAFAVHQ
jgi:hypothetical protein